MNRASVQNDTVIRRTHECRLNEEGDEEIGEAKRERERQANVSKNNIFLYVESDLPSLHSNQAFRTCFVLHLRNADLAITLRESDGSSVNTGRSVSAVHRAEKRRRRKNKIHTCVIYCIHKVYVHWILFVQVFMFSLVFT